ncbi:MAG TPA: DNA repair protein RadC [bacterium]|nr:DNA repair protein RadC [bacterium]HPN42171.1 DNA repair protein RadC [bacterium]
MGIYNTKIPDWPQDERPRERMLNHGPEALSEAELLAILLRTGSGKKTSVDLARNLLKSHEGLRGLDQQPISVLCEEKGIGLAKACQIKAALEIAKRLVQQKVRVKEQLSSSEDAYHYVHLRMRDLTHEEFRVVFLTNHNDVIAERMLFSGSVTESVVSARNIVQLAIELSAVKVILLHNHPSGNPNPSAEDKMVTQKIIKACSFFDVIVLDHIVIGNDSYYSFADHGLISSS